MKDKYNPVKIFERLVKKVLETENTTAGRINTISVIGAIIVGIIHGEFFTIYGAMIFMFAILSGIIVTISKLIVENQLIIQSLPKPRIAPPKITPRLCNRTFTAKVFMKAEGERKLSKNKGR